MNLKGRNFLTLKDFTSEEIEYLIDLSAELKAKKKQEQNINRFTNGIKANAKDLKKNWLNTKAKMMPCVSQPVLM